MRFSLRTLLLGMFFFGTLPFWLEHFLVPFFAILLVCVAMSMAGFAEGYSDDSQPFDA